MHVRWKLAQVVVPVWLAAGVGTALAAPPAPATGTEKAALDQPGILTEDSAWVFVADVPSDKLVMARQMIVANKTPMQAALALREAAALIEIQSTRAEGEEKQQLAQAAENLWTLASKVEMQKVDLKDVDRTLAVAEYSLAVHHRNLARKHLLRNEASAARRELASAARHVGRGAEWAGKETVKGVREVTGEILVLTGDATRVIGWVPEEIGKGIEAVGRGIDRLGRDVKGEVRPTRGVEEPEPTKNP